MARCAICEHPNRAAIEAELEEALTSADGMASLAERFELTIGQIKRHPGHAPAEPSAPRPKPVTPASSTTKPLPRKAAARPVPPSQEPEEEAAAEPRTRRALEHAREHVEELQKALQATVDDDERLELRKALTTAIGTQGRLERADQERVLRILKSPEWKRVEGALIAALKPFGANVLRSAGEALAKLGEDDSEQKERAA